MSDNGGNARRLGCCCCAHGSAWSAPARTWRSCGPPTRGSSWARRSSRPAAGVRWVTIVSRSGTARSVKGDDRVTLRDCSEREG
eukprot:8102379-Pyramimonas_sp.AAC.1